MTQYGACKYCGSPSMGHPCWGYAQDLEDVPPCMPMIGQIEARERINRFLLLAAVALLGAWVVAKAIF